MVGTTPSGTPKENLGHVVFITAAAAIGGFLFGYDSAVINGAVTGIQKHFQVGPVQSGFVVAIENCSALRLETLALPLSSLSGIDQSKVAKLVIPPPAGFPSHMFFDSLELVRF